jgi:anti-sigma regulatory factor (Ser/Thr protein kinase)
MSPATAPETPANGIHLSPDILPALRQQFPAYRIWREDTCGRARYVAQRARPGLHPHTVVTEDPAELRTALDPLRSCAPAPRRPGLPVSGQTRDRMPGGDVRRTRRPAPRPLRSYEQVFPGAPGHVREARRFVTARLRGCPVADDVVACVSELAANAVLHSRSRLPGGHFTVRQYVCVGAYVCVEVQDEGGPWVQRAHADGRPHGLQLVAEIADASQREGDARTGWIVWARLDWPAGGLSAAPVSRHRPPLRWMSRNASQPRGSPRATRAGW